MAVEQQLDTLASQLGDDREQILNDWRRAVAADPELVTPCGLPRAALDNNIRGILAAFEDRLRARHAVAARQVDSEQRENAAEHGTHRWQEGYDLRETIREWGHLQLAVLRALERSAAGRPEAADAVGAARDVLARLCTEGIAESVARYVQLQQTEAACRLRDLQQTLDALQALEDQRAQLLRETAHDLRGGVGVLANATALLSQPGLDESTRAHFQDLTSSRIQWIGGLLGELADLARLEAGQDPPKVGKFDVAACIKTCCEALRPLAAQKGLFLRTDGPAPFVVEGDPIKLQRIAQNLLLNALRATASGGVGIRWYPCESPDLKRWALSVQDTGPGLALRSAAPLMQAIRATTTEMKATGEAPSNAPSSPHAFPQGVGPHSDSPAEATAGEGIGLSIVKRLCEALAATVELETGPGRGTRFQILFPLEYPKRPDSSVAAHQ